MKKAKLMLGAIALVAIVGGTAAVNAKSFSADKVFTTSVAGQPGINQLNAFTLVDQGLGQQETAATTIFADPAPLTEIYQSPL
jgi:hypothetical protein